jgi:AcrR family transcriptional regulator
LRPRTKPIEERRADLLDAAEKLALERGIGGVTVDQITTVTGVSKGTFYLYFDSKDHVLQALRDRYVSRFMACQAEAVARAADPVARVEAWALAGLEDYVRDHSLHDVIFQHRTSPPAPAGPSPITALTSLLQEGIDQGAFQLPDPETTATVIYHAMHGAADHLIHTPGPRDALTAELRHLCRALLTCPRPSPH